MAVAFDVGKRRLAGDPFTLGDQVAVSVITSVSFAQMSADGSLVYVSGIPRRQLVLIDPRGVPRPLGEPGAYAWPRFSPDGNRFVMSVGGLSERSLWVYQLPSGPASRLGSNGTINDRAEWTGDGRDLLFRSNAGGRNAIWRMPVDGGDVRRVLGRDESQVDEGVLSPDGSHLLYQRDSTGNGELWYHRFRDSSSRRIVAGQGAYGGRFSPDGKWIVYTSTETGAEEVYVRPFPALNQQFRVSTSGGGTPLWSHDGRRIYYVNNGALMAATIGSVTPFSIASRSVLLGRGYSFSAIHADYDVARDGSILALQSPDETTQIVVVRNLRAELRARIRAGRAQ